MSLCCPSCFNERRVKEFILTKRSGGTVGRCSFCGSEGVLTINPKDIFELFEVFLDVLTEDVNGKSLIILVQEEICFFSDEISDKERLLDLIVDCPDILSKKYMIAHSSQPLTDWQSFKNEIIKNNRFFPQTPIYKDVFSKKDGVPTFFGLIESLEVSYSEGDRFYRARVSEELLPHTKMGKPPAEHVTVGRANPIGIPYLYLAKNEVTCISEVRPSNSAKVCIATFKPQPYKTIKLLDLTAPRKKASFLLFDGDELRESLNYIALLEVFSKELSLPVLPEKSHLDYIPTQFICEFFKTICGFDGVIFKSSFGCGENVVLFSDENVQAAHSVVHYKISGITPVFDSV